MTEKDLAKNTLIIYYLLLIIIIGFILRDYLLSFYLPILIPFILFWLPCLEMGAFNEFLPAFDMVTYFKFIYRHWIVHVIIYLTIIILLVGFLTLKNLATW